MAPMEDREYQESVIASDSDDDLEEDDDDEENAFFEETNPDFEDTLGAFKTRNPDDNRWQRRFIQTSSTKSRFCKTVETVLVVHGWETPEKKQPMSLIILSVSLNCQSRNFRIQSARMWLAFYEDTKQETWNKTREKRDVTTSYGGNIGAEKYVKAGAEGKREAYGVNWFCEQNDITKYGVKPHFHLAVLLKRNRSKDENKPVSFSGIFDMRIEAGFLPDFDSGMRRAFRLGKPENEAIYYNPDPVTPDQMFGLEGEGAIIKEKVKKENLGELMEKGRLSGLLDSNGTLSGLEPMAPKKA